MMGVSTGFVSFLFTGEECLGEVLVTPQEKDLSYVQFLFGQEIRLSSLSQPSERCLPLTVLRTITPSGPLFKMVPTDKQLNADHHRVDNLYSTCIQESKTAVVEMENGNELHLVPMRSRGIQGRPCFWAFLTSRGMYVSCLGMLNLRCLALVFDLDETLIVANTMKSFENRIDALDRKVRGMEIDQQRRASLVAELKRYQEDKSLLKQFVDSDEIMDNGNIIAAQGEIVSPLSDEGLPILRPVIRLPDRNMVLTRINPGVRDTSVLVRLRPAWEELRGYLIAKGRKRFEVYICTMSEKDYALEMWRLLDPEARLINTRELIDRVICVKSGNKKSLLNVFPTHACHPKMAMVVDDRLKVWEESDQGSVHVVPAFAPYYSPSAEATAQIPVLCVARNVACNVRAGFFKYFDENLSQQMAEVHFDTDLTTLPNSPDVSNYLVSEALNDTPHLQNFAGDTEEPPRLPSTQMMLAPPPMSHILGNHIAQPMILEPEQQEEAEPYMYGGQQAIQHYQQQLQQQQLQQQIQQQPVLLRPPPLSVMHRNSEQASTPPPPVREEGELPPDEIDPDTRRRLLILKHGVAPNHARDSLPLEDPHGKASGVIPTYSGPGGWLGVEEEMSPRRITRSSPELVLEPELPSFDNQEQQQGPPGFSSVLDNPFPNLRGGPGPGPGPRHPRRRFSQEEVFSLDEREGPDGFALENSSGSDDNEQAIGRKLAVSQQQQQELQLHSVERPGTTDFVGVLQGIAQQVKAVVDYRERLTTSTTRLLFTVEVLFAGQQVGEGTGRTKKEARFRAAEHALRFLARQFPTQALQSSIGLGASLGNHSFLGPIDDEPTMIIRQPSRDPRLPAGLGPGPGPGRGGMELVVPSTSGQVGFGEFHRPATNFVTSLKEKCTILGVNVNFKDVPNSGASGRKIFLCHVEVGGQLMGKGTGLNWDTAKQQAADDALRALKQQQQQQPSNKRINNTPSNRSPPVGAKRNRNGLPSSPGRGRGWSSPRRRGPLP